MIWTSSALYVAVSLGSYHNIWRIPYIWMLIVALGLLAIVLSLILLKQRRDIAKEEVNYGP